MQQICFGKLFFVLIVFSLGGFSAHEMHLFGLINSNTIWTTMY